MVAGSSTSSISSASTSAIISSTVLLILALLYSTSTSTSWVYVGGWDHTMVCGPGTWNVHTHKGPFSLIIQDKVSFFKHRPGKNGGSAVHGVGSSINALMYPP